MNPAKRTDSTPASEPQPVAYDVEGRPLYHHPPVAPAPASQPRQDSLIGNGDSHVGSTAPAHDGQNFDPRLRAQYANEPSVVHARREIEPEPYEISDEVRKKHEDSKKRYPFLNLSEGEYVILMLRRHPLGLLGTIASVGVVILVLMMILIMYPADGGALGVSYGTVLLPVVALMALVGIGGYIAVWIYLQNQFFMTNESVIQEIQQGLFSRHEQTVSLGSIEDVSFMKHGLIPTLFNFGLIRLSTEGEETTYQFNYVADPKQQTAILNNAVEAFKNGRPVTDTIVSK